MEFLIFRLQKFMKNIFEVRKIEEIDLFKFLGIRGTY
jgi:hypothetical protein